MSVEDKKFYALKLMCDQTKENANEIVEYSITISENAKGGQYRQLQSINAFRKLQADIRKKYSHWFTVYDHHESTGRSWKKQYEDAFNINISVVECESLWDFFDKIGWDKKSRKLNNVV